MPRFGITLKNQQLNGFVEDVEKARKLFKSSAKYGFKENDERTVKSALVQYLMTMLFQYNRLPKFEGVNAVDKMKILHQDATKIEEIAKEKGIKWTFQDMYGFLMKNPTKVEFGDNIYLYGDQIGLLFQFFEEEIGEEKLMKGNKTVLGLSVDYDAAYRKQFPEEFVQEEEVKEESIQEEVVEPEKEPVNEQSKIEPEIKPEKEPEKEQIKIAPEKEPIKIELENEEINTNIQPQNQPEQAQNQDEHIVEEHEEPIQIQNKEEQPQQEVESIYNRKFFPELLAQEDLEMISTEKDGWNLIAFQQQKGQNKEFNRKYMVADVKLKQHFLVETRLEKSRETVEKFLDGAVPGTPEFLPKVEQMIIAMANGEKIFYRQEEYPEVNGSRINAGRFVHDALSHMIPNFDIYFIDMEPVVNDAIKNYGDIQPIVFKNQRADAKILTDLFKDKSLKDQKKAFSRLMDNILDTKTLEALPLKGLLGLCDRNFNGVGQAVQHILEVCKTFNIEHGLTADDMKNICISKINGAQAAREMEHKFKRFDLNRMNRHELSDQELTALDRQNRNSQHYESAIRKMRGITVDKNNNLLKDAFATYAQLKDLHATRGFFFWVFKHGQYSAEATAIKNMEDTFKQQYHLTDDEIAQKASLNKDLANDKLNNAIASMKDTERDFRNRIALAQNREQQRKIMVGEIVGEIAEEPLREQLVLGTNELGEQQLDNGNIQIQVNAPEAVNEVNNQNLVNNQQPNEQPVLNNQNDQPKLGN